MHERRARLLTIKRLIRDNRIKSQDELLDLLGSEGYRITQATLSRDLKYLRVGKISDGGNGYRYAVTDEDILREPNESYIQDLIRGWVSIEFAANIGVVKTLAGHADAVAIALDNLELEELLGTVAGDDTVMLVLRENAGRQGFLRRLGDRVPEIRPFLR